MAKHKKAAAKQGHNHRGRKAITERSKSEVRSEVKELLVDLHEAEDPDDKKRIRRALRRRGHTGGLGVKR